MAIDNFIPDIWSAAVEEEYLATQVVIPTVTGKYEGDVSRGNTVKITGAVVPTITDYSSTRTITAEAINDDGQDLNIDQEKAWSIILDDIDKVQAAGSLEAWASSAGRALAEDAESFMINKLLTQSWSLNVTGDTPLTVTTYAHAKAVLLAVRKHLTNRKVPEGNRFAVANPAFVTLLLDGLADNSIAGGSNELRNGYVTRLFGMDILESPLVGDQAKPTVIGYHESSAAFVSQIQETEALRHQTKFADIVRGLNVYGGKVIRQFGAASFVSGGTTQNAFSSFLS
jgi:hypothetical protein